MIEKVMMKPRVAVWLLVGLTIPWQLGGKGPAAVLASMLLVVLAAFLLLRSSAVSGVNIKGWVGLPLGLLAWATFSLVWSVNRYQTVVWLAVLILAVAAFWLALSFGNMRRLRTDWLNGYQVVATLTALWGIVIYLTQNYNRLTSSFYLANPLAAYILPAFCLSLWRFAKTGKRLSAVCAPILAAALVLSDSRSAFLMLGLVVVAGAFTRLELKSWLRILSVTGVSVVLVFGINLGRSNLFHHNAATPGARFNEAVAGESTSGSDRFNYLKSTLAIWQAFPVLGTGAGTFGTVHPQYQYRVISAATNAHNFYAQTVAELGLVGGLLVAAILAALGWVIVGSFRHKQRRALALILAIMLVHLALDIDALYPSIMVVMAVLAGLVVSGREPRTILVPVWRNCLMWVLGIALVGTIPAWGAYQSSRQAQAASVAQSEGSYELAAELYGVAHSGWTYDPDVLNAEGINRYTLAGLAKDPKQATASYERAKGLAVAAKSLDPLDAQQVFLEARVLFKQHKTVEAEAAYKRTIQLDPYNHPDYYADLAYLYLLDNQPAQVMTTTSAAIKQYPDAVVANRNSDLAVKGYLGALYYFRALAEQENDPGRAKADAQKALKLNSRNQDARQLIERL